MGLWNKILRRKDPVQEKIEKLRSVTDVPLQGEIASNQQVVTPPLEIDPFSEAVKVSLRVILDEYPIYDQRLMDFLSETDEPSSDFERIRNTALVGIESVTSLEDSQVLSFWEMLRYVHCNQKVLDTNAVLSKPFNLPGWGLVVGRVWTMNASKEVWLCTPKPKSVWPASHRVPVSV